MASRTKLLALLLTFALAAACGGDSQNTNGESSGGDSTQEFNESFAGAKAYPVFVSSELTVGSNRFLIGLLDDNDAPIGDPGIDVEIAFYDLARSDTEPVSRQDMGFIWAVPKQRGLYVTRATFDRAGKWGAEVNITGGDLDESVKGNFTVKESGTTPSPGDRVPASDTPTADDVNDLAEISTDPNPDPRFYELSIAGAVKAAKPFVVVFSTPKFCTSQVCGPTLDIVKSLADDFAGVNFVHVEVYTNLDDPANLEPVPATKEWGLPSEPWVFVVDSKGRLAAEYEGVLGAQELRTELQRQTS
ncbi:MAG: TlpA family protein disulfide reductase [Actinomycetota bacterium]